MIRVLIVEDSPAVQRVLVSLLDDEAGIEVVGVAKTGIEALELCREKRPDLVTMDIYMPEMDGLEATRQIMERFPTRIVIISSMLDSNNLKTFKAIQSGAINVIEKPHGVLTGNYSEVKETLTKIIQTLMVAKPERRFSGVAPAPWTAPEKSAGSKNSHPSSVPGRITPADGVTTPTTHRITISKDFYPEVICIGGSTGAPAILGDILGALPEDYPFPIVAAQHITPGFINGMVDWLDSAVPLRVKLAKHGELIRPGTVNIAPDDAHIAIGSKGRVRLTRPAPKDLYAPSMDLFFGSVADSFEDRSLGIVLSGMGNDGTEGLLEMYAKGAITVAQDRSSSVIYGMPREAWEAGAIVRQMNPSQIISFLKRLGARSVPPPNRNRHI